MSKNIYPSNATWITPRSEETQVTSDNCVILLPKKIDHVDKVILNCEIIQTSIWVTVEGIGDSVPKQCPISDLYLDRAGTKKIGNIDLMAYIPEKAEYDTLPVIQGRNISDNELLQLYKNNTWYYTHEGNTIRLVNDRMGSLIFPEAVTENLVRGVLLRIMQTAEPNFDGKRTFYYKDEYGDMWQVTPPGAYSFYDGLFPPTMQFRVEYTPLAESVKLQTAKTEPQKNEFQMPFSQQQPIVNNVTLGREMQSTANRTGCETKEIVRTVTTLGGLRKIGSYWRERDGNGNLTGNVWRLTARRLQIYCDRLFRVVETWSKNWSFRSKNVPINREFRSWNIPADIVQRNMLWNDYCLITENAKISLPKDSILSTEAQLQVLITLVSNNGEYNLFRNECAIMWFYTITNGNRSGVALSCSSFGFGNSMVFSAKTKDNLSAGMQRQPLNNNDINYQFCRDVYYCNADGTLPQIYIQSAGEFLSTNSGADVYAYPEYSDNGIIRVNGIPTSHRLFAPDTRFKVQKDAAEQLNFTYQLHLVTDCPALIIGNGWAANCPLVKSAPDGVTTVVWLLTRYLPAGARTMTTLYGRQITSGEANPVSINAMTNSVTFSLTAEQVASGVFGVCISDERNNIILAYNGTERKTLYLRYTHFYANIYAALQQLQLQEQQQTDNQ